MKIKSAKINFGAWGLALLLLAGATDALAEKLEQASIADSSWDFELFIDGWLPKAPVTIRSGDIEVEAPENLNRILDSLKLIMEVRTTAHKGPLGFFLNPIAYKGTFKEGINITHLPTGEADGALKLKEAVWLVDYGISYEIGRWDIGKGENSRIVTLEPYAGGRFLHDVIELKVGSELIGKGFTERVTISTNSPIVGIKSSIQLNKNWDFLLQGDIGGFGVNKMNTTYLMSSYFSYKFNWWKFYSRLSVGYRFIHADVVGEKASISVKVQGPLIGLSFIF